MFGIGMDIDGGILGKGGRKELAGAANGDMGCGLAIGDKGIWVGDLYGDRAAKCDRGEEVGDWIGGVRDPDGPG